MNASVVYARIVPYVCVILALAGVVFYVGYAIEENNKRTCRVYQLIYQPSPDTPVPDPKDPRQQRASEIRKEIGKLIEQYHCNENGNS